MSAVVLGLILAAGLVLLAVWLAAGAENRGVAVLDETKESDGG